jgi:hypothetical protein
MLPNRWTPDPLTGLGKTFWVDMWPRCLEKDDSIWIQSRDGLSVRINLLQSKCLRERHGVRSVGQAEQLAEPPPDHKRRWCKCTLCQRLRRDKCKDPAKCIERAKRLLDTLPGKWDPMNENTIAEGNNHERADLDEEGGEWITFKPHSLVLGELSNAFRIFTDGEVYNGPIPIREIDDAARTTTVATDGSCENNGQSTARAGSGVFYDYDDERNIAVRVPGIFTQSNQTFDILHGWRCTTHTCWERIG